MKIINKRFAKRKIRTFKHPDGRSTRVFYIEDDGTKYFVGDYATSNLDFIAQDIKNKFKEIIKDA